METLLKITPPRSDADSEGAERVFGDFFKLYQPLLTCAETYLGNVITKTDPIYGNAYRPWHKALHDLLQGVFLMTKKIPLPNKENFIEALRLFSFESAIQFLKDICISCRLSLQRDWEKDFHEHINMLLFSLSILNRQQKSGITR